ncbi:hypothetical protein BDK51DRAFT_48490 [Blyttiomyces helicus]|uniref:Uncharacterized protein n=1 Tax=Blyttiomyces helicus TaxID=388810 RepID=A0A4P9WC45_9FUNG|nr:hypothetical protein BDK51DRAFT_48490 [Blyttiomyces helicus]|eukprot:RKO88450.1 hypothetical protein BDK51DRAFT_48490 [Blyttiomyces helicus]
MRDLQRGLPPPCSTCSSTRHRSQEIRNRTTEPLPNLFVSQSGRQALRSTKHNAVLQQDRCGSGSLPCEHDRIASILGIDYRVRSTRRRALSWSIRKGPGELWGVDQSRSRADETLSRRLKDIRQAVGPTTPSRGSDKGWVYMGGAKRPAFEPSIPAWPGRNVIIRAHASSCELHPANYVVARQAGNLMEAEQTAAPREEGSRGSSGEGEAPFAARPSSIWHDYTHDARRRSTSKQKNLALLALLLPDSRTGFVSRLSGFERSANLRIADPIISDPVGERRSKARRATPFNGVAGSERAFCWPAVHKNYVHSSQSSSFLPQVANTPAIMRLSPRPTTGRPHTRPPKIVILRLAGRRFLSTLAIAPEPKPEHMQALTQAIMSFAL